MLEVAVYLNEPSTYIKGIIDAPIGQSIGARKGEREEKGLSGVPLSYWVVQLYLSLDLSLDKERKPSRIAAGSRR
jgi:hypothetical protein